MAPQERPHPEDQEPRTESVADTTDTLRHFLRGIIIEHGNEGQIILREADEEPGEA